MVANRLSTEDIELLAWIDFCKQQNVELKEETFEFMASLRSIFNPDVMKNHLTELWQKYGDHNEDTESPIPLVDMLTKGSAYMIKLTGEMHEAITSRVDQHISNNESQRVIRFMRDSEEERETTGYPRLLTLEVGEKKGVKRSKPPEGSDNSPIFKKHRSSRGEPSTKAIKDTAADGNMKCQLSTQTPVANSTEVAVVLENCDDKEDIRGRPRALPSDSEHQAMNRENCMEYLRSMEKKYNLGIDHIQGLWQTEVEKLSIKEAEAQKTIRDLKAQVKHLNEARKFRQECQKSQQEDANVSLETRQFEDLEEIYRLTKDNREMHRFATLADLDLPGSLHLGHDAVDDAMDQIKFELSSISYRRNSDLPLFPKIFAISGDLRNLILSAFGSDIETAVGRKGVHTMMKKFNPQICIRVLVLAALRDWVFMSKFPNFATSDSRLLSSYRHIISSMDGNHRLYSLDIAAHRAIMERLWFKEDLIPRRATDLAARLSNAIAPLFANKTDSVEDELFHTWGEHQECWEDRRTHLQEIFQTALTLKADSVVTKSRYEFAIYPAGTTFMGEITTDEISSGSKSGSSWIHASFHIYDAKIVSNPKDDALVQTQNFVIGTTEGRDSAKYSKIMVFPKRPSEVVSSRITEVTENLGSIQIASDNSTGNSRTDKEAKALGSNKTTDAHKSIVDASQPKRSKEQPLPKCDECDETFPATSSLRRHEKNRSCTKCPHCGKLFRRAHNMRKHNRDEHEEYRPSNRQECVVDGDTNSVIRGALRNAIEPQSLEVTSIKSTELEFGRYGSDLVDKRSLANHLEKDKCVLTCKNCNRKFKNDEERGKHQCTKNHPTSKPLFAAFATESQATVADNCQKGSTQKRIENEVPRYKKAPRKEVEDSDADDVLSPEIAKTKRTQSRKFTRSSDGRAEMRMNDIQESPVRPGRQPKKILEG
ncbi:hypothetical protein EYC80_009406 [Monilinia laxa]|uniref:C2H2-type domain-containing protein n=1 Tax=Monilinia laxa TaxID=61186 RepID=A0A5N6JXQ3_MONLA|nr:hypothetical protein EYC80_009406 [Monilinia laxa]